MKSITLFFLIALSFTAFSQHQTVGVSGGISASNILYNVKVANPAEYRIGYLFKVNYEVAISKSAFFATGATYQEKGFTNSILGFNRVEANNKHTYLGIPFGIGFQAGQQIYGKFLIQANASMLISHESGLKIFNNDGSYQETNILNTQDYTPFDFSINPTGRFGYRFGSGLGLFIEGSFSLSLNNFMNQITAPFSAPVRNYAFGGCIGIDFKL